MPKKKTKEEFLLSCKKIHGDKYDYSLVDYVNNKTKVKITCKKHGIFEQRPDNHIQNQDCPHCIDNNIRKTKEEFIKKSIDKYGDVLDYSLVDYKSLKLPVKLVCKSHGVFEQNAGNHLSKSMITPCKKCDSENRIINLNIVISRLKEIHNHFYDYSKLEYDGRMKKSIIICPVHGEFEQQIHSHMLGSGCKKCSASNGEKLIQFILIENNIDFLIEHKFDNCKDKSHLRFDFFIPSLNTCIEYNGMQHYKEVPFFGGKDFLDNITKKDKIKIEYCSENNIRLITFKYNDSKEKIKNELLLLIHSKV